MPTPMDGPQPEKLGSEPTTPRMPNRLRAGIGKTEPVIEDRRVATRLQVVTRKTRGGVAIFSLQLIRRVDSTPITWINLDEDEARQVKALLDAWLER